MANETTRTTANDILLQSLVNDKVIAAARAAAVMGPLVFRKDLDPNASPIAAIFPSWPKTTAAALSEGSDLSNTAVSTGGVTVTASTHGLLVKPTDVLRSTSIFGMADDPWFEEMGRAVADLYDDDLCALLAGFSSTVGSSGVDLTIANFLSAIYTLENADAPSGNPSEPTSYGPIPAGLQGKLCVLHPIQVLDLRTAVSNAGASWFADPKAADILFVNGNKPAGFVGQFMGVPIFQSTNVDTANAGADRAGAMFTPTALGSLIKWLAKFESDRDISMLATELVGSGFWGEAELVDGYGVSIITDA